MSERKYTDEEIINKMSAYIEMSCRMCGFKTLCNELCAIEFIKAALKAALGLIKSQKAENEKLQEVNADLNESLRLAAEANKDLNAEIEDLREIVFTDRTEAIKNLKAEAIKEFAERLHKGIDDFRDKREMVMLPYTESALLIIERKIDNLVAEMTEGE